MRTFFDVDNRLERLKKMGDVLVRLNAAIAWESFRGLLEEIYYTEDKRAGGRKPYDRVMMFKILVLQSLYNLSDDAMEYQINDRLSFQRFLNLDIGDTVPDAKTIWLFRENLVKSGRSREIFDFYNAKLESAGMITRRGSIVDATFVERPRQYAGETKESATENNENENSKNENRKRQIDADAKGVSKGRKSFFGFKNHIKVDVDSKLITKFSVTHAARHDGKEAPTILDEDDKEVYADAIYRGEKIEKAMKDAAPNATFHIIRKHDGTHEPTAEQLKNNIPISKVRQRVEHVFGFMVKSMGGKHIRSCGLARATTAVTLKNLVYNMRRAMFLMG
jgi:IS5 family transposase